jgi:hypothetical protein
MKDKAIKAIEEIAKKKNDSISIMAELALKNKDIIPFVEYVANGYYRGLGAILILHCDKKNVDVILDYAKVINAQAQIECQDKCLFMDQINLN